MKCQYDSAAVTISETICFAKTTVILRGTLPQAQRSLLYKKQIKTQVSIRAQQRKQANKFSENQLVVAVFSKRTFRNVPREQEPSWWVMEVFYVLQFYLTVGRSIALIFLSKPHLFRAYMHAIGVRVVSLEQGASGICEWSVFFILNL